MEYTLDTVMDITEVFCLFIKIKDSFRIMKLNFARLYSSGAAKVEYGRSVLWEDLSGRVSIQSGPN